MTNYLKVDVKKMALVYDRAFAKNCFIVGTAEYAQLQDAMKTFPNFKLEQRSIKKNAKKECYKGLTYDYMRDYIIRHESEKEGKVVMSELDEMLLISECHSIAYRYPTIKKWFLERYPEVKMFGQNAEDATENDKTAEIEAVA